MSGTVWDVHVAGNGTFTHNGDRIAGMMDGLDLTGQGEKIAEIVYVDSGAAARAADKANAAYGKINAGQVTRSGRRLTFKRPLDGEITLMEFMHGM